MAGTHLQHSSGSPASRAAYDGRRALQRAAPVRATAGLATRQRRPGAWASGPPGAMYSASGTRAASAVRTPGPRQIAPGSFYSPLAQSRNLRMSKITPLSGYPEWLPEIRIVEQRILDTIRSKFELFGFASIETRAVEPLEVLLSKGETDKEIYAIRRLWGSEDEHKGLGLHYDLTVPFARYVSQYREGLSFPFKRYQIQKSWRGERPQEGRYREFYQADIDVVGQDRLPLHFDAEMAAVASQVLAALPIPSIRLHVNNRKILQGAYESLEIEDPHGALRIVDKLDKIGEAGVREQLEAIGLTAAQAAGCFRLGLIQGGMSFAEQVRALGLRGKLLDEGLEELTMVLDMTQRMCGGACSTIADLRIARGLDYYTGTVYEGLMQGHESLGAVCSGGRYDSLVPPVAGRAMPGVGISIGVSRILGRLVRERKLQASRSTPTCVLVAVLDDRHRDSALSAGAGLRSRGIPTEVYHEASKLDKQVRYAERKGIPFLWFPGESGGSGRIRDLRMRTEADADPHSWSPSAEDLNPQVSPASETGGHVQ